MVSVTVTSERHQGRISTFRVGSHILRMLYGVPQPTWMRTKLPLGYSILRTPYSVFRCGIKSRSGGKEALQCDKDLGSKSPFLFCPPSHSKVLGSV